ncbi:hypothetical protein RR48_11658 [Papilio machaon]|uniref:Uncharacterized protein n=1 Tax=Papilio machaon TaxID=76193 RepID=A0A194R3Y7_PAPMA|nr:hypothetical protein RR48_11658 [Papilio machaon]
MSHDKLRVSQRDMEAAVCKNRFELECDGYPEKTYHLMNQEAKKKWRCKTCKTNDVVKSGISNITTRRKRIPDRPPTSSTLSNTEEQVCVEPSLNFSLTSDSHILTDHNTSDESMSTPTRLSKIVEDNDTATIPVMKNMISQMSFTLKTTQKELENLTLENNNLRKILNKLTAENKFLKSLAQSCPTIECSLGLSDETKKSESPLYDESVILSSSPVTKSISNDHDIDSTLLNVREIITSLQLQLQTAEEKIMAFKGKPSITSQDVNHKHIIAMRNDKTHKTSEAQKRLPSKQIYIFGSQQCVGLAAAVSHSRCYTQYEKYQLIAETKPYAPCNEVIKRCAVPGVNLGGECIFI